MAIKDINDGSQMLRARDNRFFLHMILARLKIHPSLVEIIPPIRNTNQNQISNQIDEKSRFIQLDQLDESRMSNLPDDNRRFDQLNPIGTRSTIKGMPNIEKHNHSNIMPFRFRAPPLCEPTCHERIQGIRSQLKKSHQSSTLLRKRNLFLASQPNNNTNLPLL
ncbi:hypothetical protein PGTUg99_005152 [Puccinia graminis f. sp. tritici]|uniref:Uncharacterized protein n=1 Tax=Puccinia graminis f. sp. tritici TaxID=56615 RepID=A0A5B0RDN6_PUCGR|nr:hypothetical protein PGTUg99_005152 [Puccinia graminis f. sp. tritici]